MNCFAHENFLLGTPTAKKLYHEVAAGLPVIDFHCHLDPEQLLANSPFSNVTQAWITNDPYKHRAMRMAGTPERFVTGQSTDQEKFAAWAATVPLTVGNPLFGWTALELKRHFAIETLLGPPTRDAIWRRCNELLEGPGGRPREFVRRSNVECLCTSDRLLDDLASHARLARTDFPGKVLPSLRGDDIVAVEAPHYGAWLGELGRSVSTVIDSFDAFQHGIRLRLDHFCAHGCRLSDHAFDDFDYLPADRGHIERLFARRLTAAPMDPTELCQLRSGILLFLAEEIRRRHWALQLHLGVQRRTSARLRELAGSNGGYATIGRSCDVATLCAFFSDLEAGSGVPRIILYPLHPSDYPVLASLAGSYSEDHVQAKIQLGPAWWYNDHVQGIKQHLHAVASYSLLRTFVGMTTDARSPLSLSRQEYFRRVFCDFLGHEVEAGTLPHDHELLAGVVRAVAYENPRALVLSDET